MATLKQKKAIKNIVENRGNVYKGMIEAGYPHSTAKNPSNLTESKAWLELMDDNITDEDLIKVHKQGLKAYRKYPQITDRDDKGRPIYEYVQQPDFDARHKYLETAYKLKARYSETPESARPLTLNILNFYGKDATARDNDSIPIHT